MKNTQINLRAIERVAEALGDLNERVIYVGGATVSLYIDDSAAEDVRPTQDIDVVIEVASFVELEEIRQELSDRGFRQSSEDDVRCRFRFDDMKVDVMSTQAVDWAPSDRWYQPGFDNANEMEIGSQTIRLMPFCYFLASKFEAFNDREEDPRASKHIEDIAYLLNYRSDFHLDIQNAWDEVKEYLNSQLESIRDEDRLQEAILGNLFHENQEVRFQRILDKIDQSLNGV